MEIIGKIVDFIHVIIDMIPDGIDAYGLITQYSWLIALAICIGAGIVVAKKIGEGVIGIFGSFNPKIIGVCVVAVLAILFFSR